MTEQGIAGAATAVPEADRRIKVLLAAVIERARGRFPVRITDISSHGVSAAADEPPEPGTHVTLRR